MHFGLLCPEMVGHLNPALTLCRELKRRGHKVTLFGRLDAEAITLDAGVSFQPYGETEFPLGSVKVESRQIGELTGEAAVSCSMEFFRLVARVALVELPLLIIDRNVEILLIDQVFAAGSTISEVCDVPYITICCALVIKPDSYLLGPICYKLAGEVMDYRVRKFGLTEPKRPLLQIAQQPWFFGSGSRGCEFTGPWKESDWPKLVPFDWQKLDGRPLVYASMGTIQNRVMEVFWLIALACKELQCQLVISFGRKDAEVTNLPGGPVVVPYAPQLLLLRAADLFVTHAGMNSVLESILTKTPMLCLPVTNDQHEIAGLVESCRLGLRSKSDRSVGSEIERLLKQDGYDIEALHKASNITSGVELAANLIETFL